MFKGSVKAKDYGCFIANLINQHQYIKNNLKNFVFYHDNARIHHAKILKDFFSYINIFYCPAYSPFLNPIEEVFFNFKLKLQFIQKNNVA